MGKRKHKLPESQNRWRKLVEQSYWLNMLNVDFSNAYVDCSTIYPNGHRLDCKVSGLGCESEV